MLMTRGSAPSLDETLSLLPSGSLIILAVTEIELPFVTGLSFLVAESFSCAQDRKGRFAGCSESGTGAGGCACFGGTVVVDVFGTRDTCAIDDRFLNGEKPPGDFA
jgi:hypothetical protein